MTVSYEVAGILSPKSIHEVEHELTLGCEVLDRDYTDYQQYKEYLTPLGFKKIRLQAGWAKTEKEKVSTTLPGWTPSSTMPWGVV